jgi:hypothetical protein
MLEKEHGCRRAAFEEAKVEYNYQDFVATAG